MKGNQAMTIRFSLILLTLMTNVLLPFAHPARAAATLELYGTFHAMGVIVNIAATDDPDRDAVANVMYQISGSGFYRQGFPLSRISDTQFVGSLFWLFPGTTYDVHVTFSDPDGALHGMTIESTASTRAEITIPSPNDSYYVSPTGSGVACSLAAPCSLIEGLNQAQPGDEVVLRGGVYYQGEITLPRSGAAGAPIVIRSYTGETAILDGADPATFTWTHQGGGVWSTTVNVADTRLVVANGDRLYPYQSLSDLQNLVWSLPGFYASDTTIYVRLAGDANPNNATMVVSRQNHAFWVEQNFIYILDLTFRHYGQGGYPRAIYLRNGSDNLVQDCTFAINDLGIAIKLDSHRNVIQNNEFYDTIFDWSWDAVKATDSLETSSIKFWDPSSGQGNMIARGNIIRRNVFHDFFDGFHGCPGTDQMQGVTNETDVYENLVYNAVDDGMQTDGACSNVRIWSNTFHDVLVGISLAPARIGSVYAARNLMYRSGWTAFKFSYDFPGSGPMYLFHNTVVSEPGGNGIWMSESATWPLLVARNNIWVGDDGFAIGYHVDDPVDFDYDNLWRTTDGPLVYWNGANYQHASELCGSEGQECHGFSVPPGFSDPAGDNYTLDPTSQLIDAGLHIPGINDDYAGAAPDIGAFEYQSYGFTLNALPPARAIAPGGVATYIIEVQPTGGFSSTVALEVTYLSPSLTLQLDPMDLTPPAYATLTITDSHSGSELLPGLWYTIPITATGGGVTQLTSVGLLVGGTRIYLPIVLSEPHSTP